MQKFPQAGFRIEQQEKVGTLVGSELARNSLIALGLGMLGILFYVTLRFEFSFALGALVALLHDVVITIGMFALFGRELSLIIVGAALTIAGYSVNDTLVVFDRIREEIKNGRRGSIIEIMNLAINETLSRTILTGGVTLLTTAALFIFGGPVLNDFAFAILIGVLVGTYSSIFIAAPIVLWWSGLGGRNLRVEVKRSAAGELPA
jgi:preprotein translocase SecF subunit